ncbi:MAG: hypothetical protein IT464_07345 [Planctomycetes bacterium]|nr:hypothetical protein [Planctomycetota bacterium]
MKKPHAPVVAVGIVAGMLAAAGIFALTLASRGVAAEVPVAHAPATAIQQPDPAPAAPEGPNVSPPAPESAERFSNNSVEDLLAGVFPAIERGDRNWLARTLESTHGRGLTEDDLHAAYRNFLWRSAAPLWSRLRAAWDARAYDVSYEGDSATVAFHVGGAAGTITYNFCRVGNGWHFAGI